MSMGWVGYGGPGRVKIFVNYLWLVSHIGSKIVSTYDTFLKSLSAYYDANCANSACAKLK